MGNFCPFIKSKCRDDCVFKCGNVPVGKNLYNCLIAVKLLDINEHQHDDLVNIWQELDQ